MPTQPKHIQMSFTLYLPLRTQQVQLGDRVTGGEERRLDLVNFREYRVTEAR